MRASRNGFSSYLLVAIVASALLLFGFTWVNYSDRSTTIVEFTSKAELLPLEQLHQLQKTVEHLQNSLIRAVYRTEQLSCELKKIGTRGGFCLTPEALEVGGNWMWDLPLSMEMEQMMEKETVGDFGAGLGWYGRYFMRSRQPFFAKAFEVEKKHYLDVPAVLTALEMPKRIHSWKGYDGAVYVTEVTGGLVKYLDLSDPVYLPEKYGWVMSLEVGEHIPADYENYFVDNLARHACKGIVLSWAVPGQGGHNHVNNRDNEYVKGQLAKRGFKWDEAWQARLRNAATLTWLKNTVMVFRRSSESDDPQCKTPSSNDTSSWFNSVFGMKENRHLINP